MVGFRNGMCHPFRPFNLNTNKEIEILEIPLAIMDVTLFENYLKLDARRAWEITKLLIDNVRSCNGVLTVLWHNTLMLKDLKFYEKILEYCNRNNALMTSGEEIWRIAPKTSLVRRARELLFRINGGKRLCC
jgi:hypothetical protein